MIPAGGATQTLSRLRGSAAAMHLILTGERIAAREAEVRGLVDVVVPRAELAARTDALADDLARRPPTAVRAAKRAVWAALDGPLAVGLGLEADLALPRSTPERAAWPSRPRCPLAWPHGSTTHRSPGSHWRRGQWRRAEPQPGGPPPRALPRRALSHARCVGDSGSTFHARGRSAWLPVRLGRQLRPRRSREPAVLRQPHGRAHPERHPRPTGEPARDRAGTRRRRPPRQRQGHLDGSAVDRGRRRPRPPPRALPRGQPDRGVLHRLRRLHLLPARRGEHPVRRWLRTDELGRPGRVRRGRPRSARRRPRPDHRAHERRPRRRAGPVLPSSRRATRHHGGHDVRRRPLRLRDDRGQPCRSCRGTARLPAGVHDRAYEVRQAMVAMVADARAAAELACG